MQHVRDLTPKALWKHFEALSAIPRVSKNEKAAADYVERFARDRNLDVQRDRAGNLLVRKPATPGRENRVPVILQSHLDMVGQKTSSSSHDFARDPLRLVIDGEWLRADGTTLGADNGIGAAAALAMLESTGVAHGPLSALFTVEEEIGLRGASAVSPDFLPGELLINLDADLPGELIIGCAGAVTSRVDLRVDRVAVPLQSRGLRVRLHGLLGGHSGADIHRGRGNALRLMARLLLDCGAEGKYGLSAFAGGDARNAIPREASVLLAVPAALAASVRENLWAGVDALRQELSRHEPGFAVSIEECPPPAETLTAESAFRYLAFLRNCPSGVVRMSSEQDGVVETSNNLAITSLGDSGPASAHCLTRSLVESAKQDVAATLSSLASLAGGTIEISGNYPGWQPARSSRLVGLFSTVCERVLGKPAWTSVVHGGLECGILRAVKPSLDCIALGPRIEAMHSPDERVEIKSVAALHDILALALEAIPEA